jgi:hypothetical protein
MTKRQFPLPPLHSLSPFLQLRTFLEFDKILGKGPAVLKIRRKTRKIEENTMASFTMLTDITKPNFPRPRCGGREINQEHETKEDTTVMTAYMTKLEMIALAQNPQDAGPTEPPK